MDSETLDQVLTQIRTENAKLKSGQVEIQTE